LKPVATKWHEATGNVIKLRIFDKKKDRSK